mmetsp:Transcript_1566/g.3006  ORF Transcript_1566/g.3006 Transcript_1566/m.3006 type:complete len:223 (-) Transcript_1566:565-1233(-)
MWAMTKSSRFSCGCDAFRTRRSQTRSIGISSVSRCSPHSRHGLSSSNPIPIRCRPAWIASGMANFHIPNDSADQPVANCCDYIPRTADNIMGYPICTTNTGGNGTGAVPVTEAGGIPRVRIAAVAAPPGLRVVEGNVVSLVIRAGVARVAKDAGFIRLARTANPDDVVLAEGVLTDSAGRVTVHGEKMRVRSFRGLIVAAVVDSTSSSNSTRSPGWTQHKGR